MQQNLDSMPEPQMAPRSTSNRGFASMSAEKQREIARKGGKAAHQKGTAHEFSSAEAAAAGRKGGMARGKAKSRLNQPKMESPHTEQMPQEYNG